MAAPPKPLSDRDVMAVLDNQRARPKPHLNQEIWISELSSLGEKFRSQIISDDGRVEDVIARWSRVPILSLNSLEIKYRRLIEPN